MVRKRSASRSKEGKHFQDILQSLGSPEVLKDAEGWFIHLYRTLHCLDIPGTGGSMIKQTLDWLVAEGYVEADRPHSKKRRYRLTEKGQQAITVAEIVKAAPSEDQILMERVNARRHEIGARLGTLVHECQELEKESEQLHEVYLQLESAEKARERARQLLAQ